MVLRYYRNFDARVDEEQLAGTEVVDVYPYKIIHVLQDWCPVRNLHFSEGAETLLSRAFDLKSHVERHLRALSCRMSHDSNRPVSAVEHPNVPTIVVVVVEVHWRS